jgi:GTP pyrophosphokinase
VNDWTLEESLLAQAIETAMDWHGDQTDRCGAPFVGHPLRALGYLVASYGVPDEVHAACVLHDIVEDTDFTLEQVESMFGPEVGRLVAAVTRDPDLESYNDYIERVAAAGPYAIMIKIADMTDNMDPRRIDAEHQRWHESMMVKRYVPAMAYLEDALMNA